MRNKYRLIIVLVAASIDFVTDVNGSNAPNAETSNNIYHDIRNLTAARFKGCTGVDLAGIGCVVNVGTSYDCVAKGSAEQIKYDPIGPYNNSCWAGAQAKCASMGMSLPDKGTLKNIYNQKSSNPMLPQSGTFWSSTESGTYNAWRITFLTGGEGSNRKDFHSDGVLCVGD